MKNLSAHVTNPSTDTPLVLRKHLVRLLLIVPSLLVLLLFEIGYRAHLHFEDLSLEGQTAQLSAAQHEDPDRPLQLKNIIKWNKNPLILYDLIPSVSGDFIARKISINRDGFRGQTVSKQRTAPTLRIAGIGDSVMFGWGVHDSQTYLSRLSSALATTGCSKRVEVINSAVPGYNGVMAVATLEEKLLAYRPDIVLYHYVLNDLNLPSFINTKDAIWTARTSFLFRMIKRRLRNTFNSDHRLGHPPEDIRNRDYAGEENKIPEQHRDLIGLSAFQKAMVKLKRLQDETSFRVVVLTHFSMPTKIADTLNAMGFTIVNSYPHALALLEANKENRYVGSSLTVSSTDRHPSSVYHALIADVVAKELHAQAHCD